MREPPTAGMTGDIAALKINEQEVVEHLRKELIRRNLPVPETARLVISRRQHKVGQKSAVIRDGRLGRYSGIG